MVEGSSATASLRRKIGSTQTLTCEAKITDAEPCEPWEALNDEVHVRGWELVVANLETGQGLKLGHGPGQGCRNV